MLTVDISAIQYYIKSIKDIQYHIAVRFAFSETSENLLLHTVKSCSI